MPNFLEQIEHVFDTKTCIFFPSLKLFIYKSHNFTSKLYSAEHFLINI